MMGDITNRFYHLLYLPFATKVVKKHKLYVKKLLSHPKSFNPVEATALYLM